jgi:hypothetical protein
MPTPTDCMPTDVSRSFFSYNYSRLTGQSYEKTRAEQNKCIHFFCQVPSKFALEKHKDTKKMNKAKRKMI